MTVSEQFPILRTSSERAEILGGRSKLRLSIPWAMIAPHEQQALNNHGQSLRRLAERGGLSAYEALRVLHGEKLFPIRATPDDEQALDDLVEKWECEQEQSAQDIDEARQIMHLGPVKRLPQ